MQIKKNVWLIYFPSKKYIQHIIFTKNESDEVKFSFFIHLN